MVGHGVGRGRRGLAPATSPPQCPFIHNPGPEVVAARRRLDDGDMSISDPEGPQRPFERHPVAGPDDALRAAAGQLTTLNAGASARELVAEVLATVHAAFTATQAVRDPLADTAPDSAEEALAAVAGIAQLRSMLGGIEASWQVTAAERIRRDDAAHGVATAKQGRGAGHELALARRVSPSSADLSLAAARRLVQQMPGTHARLRRGTITHAQARAVASSLDRAQPHTCTQIDRILSDDPEVLDGMGTRRVRAQMQQLIQELEPEKSRERAERAARERHVRMQPMRDGMARLTAVLRAIDATAVMATLDRSASSLKASGRPGSHAALQADLLVEAVLRAPERAPEQAQKTPGSALRFIRPSLDVGVVLSDAALLHPGRYTGCALLEGYGPLPAHVVTDTMAGREPGRLEHAGHHEPEGSDGDDELVAFYRRLYTAPTSGQLVALESTARAFPAGLARMIRQRDGSCRTPWCDAPIRHIDHVQPVRNGGPTSYANGQGLCVRCNQRKEHGPWSLRPQSAQPPEAWHWSSPHGAIGRSLTPPLQPPRRMLPPPRQDTAGEGDPSRDDSQTADGTEPG